MNRQACVDVLNRVLHGTVNSVVQYIEISRPYVPPGCEPQLETIKRIRAEEAAISHDLSAALADLDGTARVGVFEYWNVDLNYLDLRFMVRFAARHQERVVAELEAELEAVREDPKVHTLLQRVLDEKRGHLAQLRAMAPESEPEPSTDAAES